MNRTSLDPTPASRLRCRGIVLDRNPAWTVSPDGSRFLGMVEQKSDAPDTINVVLNWQSALKK